MILERLLVLALAGAVLTGYMPLVRLPPPGYMVPTGLLPIL